MAEGNQQVLHDAYELIKSGQKQEAMRLLVQVLQSDRNNANAWWLLANATDEPGKKQQALEQVLRLQPDHGAARRALDTLTGADAAPPPSLSTEPTLTTRIPKAPQQDPFSDPFAAPPSSGGSRPVD